MSPPGILSDWDDAELFRALVDMAPDAVVVSDKHGRIVLANRQAEQLFGYSQQEFLGSYVEMLVPPRFRGEHPSHRGRYLESPRQRPMGSGIDLFALRKNGTEFAAEISLSPIVGREQTAVAVAIRDVTDRKRGEEKIRASLREKEVLLKEIHHRVKNNLQVTSSMLKLQSAYTQDPTARNLFIEGQHRIRSMALVHEKLYRSSELSRVPLADYVTELSRLLFRSFGVNPARIALMIDAEPIHLGIDSAVPCGLILNELISNALKHAFPEGRSGTVTVGIRRAGHGAITLSVRDDGVGLPGEVDFEYSETLGLELVRTLVQQLQGRLEICRVSGTEVTVRFLEEGPPSEL